jgi:hypothetical protein
MSTARTTAFAAALILLVAACAPSAQSPIPMPGELREDLIVLDPVAPAPGEEFRLTWPGGEPRAIAYRMGRMAADGAWYAEYVLYQGDRAPGSWEPIVPNFEIPAMATLGEGPDRLQVPGSARPGIYRVCTWDPPAACVELEVTAP